MMTGDLVRATAPPIAQKGSRVQEHGRIRFGIQVPIANPKPGGPTTRPKVLKTWRLTSPDHDAIAAVAELYGGQVSEWHEPKANPKDQWQVITTSNVLRALLPPNQLSIWYELWTGAGCQRRCDGVTAMVPGSNDNDPQREVPCLCNAKGYMECKPKTRLSVLLPEIRFAGLWRLETGSWNASEEMPAMEQMLQVMQTYGVLEVRLSLVEQTTEGGRKQFVVPKIEFASSAMDVIGGLATAAGAPERALGGAVSDLPALGRGEVVDWVESDLSEGGDPAPPPPDRESQPDPPSDVDEQLDEGRPFTQDDDVVDAEIVTDTSEASPAARAKMHAVIGEVAKRYELRKDTFRKQLIVTLTKGAKKSATELNAGEVSTLIDYLEQVTAGERRIEFYGDTVKMPRVEG